MDYGEFIGTVETMKELINMFPTITNCNIRIAYNGETGFSCSIEVWFDKETNTITLA